jgi:nitroreductase
MSSSNHPLADRPIAHTPLSLLEGLATTRAIRRYTHEPIPEAHLRDILFSATRAPSGSNRQPFRFMVLTSGDKADKAKAMIAGSAHQSLVWPEPCEATLRTLAPCLL